MIVRLRQLAAASSRDLLVLLAVVAALALVPLGVSTFTLSVATAALIFALAGIGWNVLSGFAGQFSFGHAAYFGLGAYTVAVTFTRYSISPWLGLVLGGLVAATFGLLTGWISFRFGLKGAYFALATFAHRARNAGVQQADPEEQSQPAASSLRRSSAANGYCVTVISTRRWPTRDTAEGWTWRTSKDSMKSRPAGSSPTGRCCWTWT